MDSIDMFPVQLCPCISTEQTRDLTVCSSSDAPDVASIGTGRSIVSRKANISYVLRHEALLHRQRPSRHSGGAFIIVSRTVGTWLYDVSWRGVRLQG